MMPFASEIQTLVRSKGSLSPSNDQKPGGTAGRAQFSLVNRPLDWAQGLLQTVQKPSRSSDASNGRGVCYWQSVYTDRQYLI